MKNAADHTRTLGRLLARLSRHTTDHPLPGSSPVELLIYAYLMYDTSQARATAAYRKVMGHVVDLNDLRVSDPAEIAALLGHGYPLAAERTQKLRLALNTIYRREHAVDLSSLAPRPKKEVRAYLDTLDGAVPFVAAFVTLVGFNGHAVPLDDQLYRRLLTDGVIEPDATFEETAAFLDYHIRHEDAVESHHRLRAYVERGVRFTAAKAPARAKRTTKKTTRKKTTKKQTKRR